MRRRTILVEAQAGGGAVSGMEFGPEARPLDVLFLHANGFNASAYAPILAPLGATLRVLAVDLRGHGLSGLPPLPSHPGWRLYADDLLALLRALGEAPRVLAGHSMGGTTALLAAPALPAVRALVLFDPVIVPAVLYGRVPRAPDFETPMAQAALRRKPGFATREDAFAAYRGRGAFRTWPDEMLRAYLQDGLVRAGDGVALSCTPGWEAANFAAYAMDDPLPGMAAITAPVRILQAETGSTCTLEARAGVSIETVAETSHFLPMERPEVVRAGILAAVQ
jgi:pimeloyl-ACP methyl ester carboxylesterase